MFFPRYERQEMDLEHRQGAKILECGKDHLVLQVATSKINQGGVWILRCNISIEF